MNERLAFKHVSFGYRDVLVLDDISFSVSEGEYIGIIGPNGGGKTTLLKLIMGFLKPSSGEITVLDKAPGQSLQRIAYVPQNLRYDREFPISVEDVVLSGRL